MSIDDIDELFPSSTTSTEDKTSRIVESEGNEYVASSPPPVQNKTTGYQKSYDGAYKSNQFKGGGGGFKKKDMTPQPPYLPYVIYVDDQTPEEIIGKLVSLAEKLLSLGYTVRVNGDKEVTGNRFAALPSTNIEIFPPWKGFEKFDTKFGFNTPTHVEIAKANFFAWDKMNSVIQAKLARNVRILLGGNNNSNAKCLITWTPDGVSRGRDVTRETGYSGSLIKLATRLKFPIINIANPNAKDEIRQLLEKEES